VEGHALASGAHYTVRTLSVEPGSAGRSQSAAFTEQVSSPARLDEGESAGSRSAVTDGAFVGSTPKLYGRHQKRRWA